VYEGAIRVPLVLWRPGLVPAGRVVSDPARLVDVAPTVLELLGLPPLPGAGTSFAPRLRGGSAPAGADRALLHEIPGDPARPRAITAGRYKLIRRGVDPGPVEVRLYDRVLDPRETADISAGAGELVSDLSTRLDAEFTALAPPAASP
jgi:arylsulfatase A-like enzyme